MSYPIDAAAEEGVSCPFAEKRRLALVDLIFVQLEVVQAAFGQRPAAMHKSTHTQPFNGP